MQAMRIVSKVIFAGIIAFLMLSIFTFFYYNVPIHYDSPTYSTDYVWESNKYYSRGTEGFSSGRTDANGFNNLNVPSKVDILMMGSSQMEGFNVNQNENTVAKLNDIFNGTFSVYNIGVSGHTLKVCLNNLQNAINEFKPQEYVIIETQTLMSYDELNNLYANKIERIPSVNSGLLNILQKSDYLRLLYTQYKSYKNANQDDFVVSSNQSVDYEKYEVMLNEVLNEANAFAQEASCQLIIFMDDSLKFDENGEILPREKNEYYVLLEKVCKDNNIIFVDMYEYFKDLYDIENKLPHGFSNTKVGTGHLNKYGHAVIANTLYKVIEEKEEAK